jgi:hypothetical protein
MRRLATIQEILETRPIPNADQIEVAVIKGWECVIKKNEFNVGDLVIYIEIDSIVPDRSEFEFLRDRKFRVRTIKLRGQISQGLVMPVSILPAGLEYKLDMDVTDILGIKKYDPELEAENDITSKKAIVPKWYKPLMNLKLFRIIWKKLHPKTSMKFPDWISKTDEERIQNLSGKYNSFRELLWDVREKIDGQSGTFAIKKVESKFPFAKPKWDEFICSRNWIVSGSNNYTKTDINYGIISSLHKMVKYGVLDHYAPMGIESVVLQGEIYGAGIQQNKYKVNGIRFAAFTLKVNGRNIPTEEFEPILALYSIPTVPSIAVDYGLPNTISELVEFATGKSALEDRQREGCVLRNAKTGISFKVINPNFLLENKD